jgi:hypothetical protein
MRAEAWPDETRQGINHAISFRCGYCATTRRRGDFVCGARNGPEAMSRQAGVMRACKRPQVFSSSLHSQIVCHRLAAALDDVEGDRVSFEQGVKPGLAHRRCMNDMQSLDISLSSMFEGVMPLRRRERGVVRVRTRTNRFVRAWRDREALPASHVENCSDRIRLSSLPPLGRGMEP